MCKAPKPPKPKPPEKPEFLRNRVLDRALSGAGTVAALRAGTSRFRIDLGSNLGIRQPGEAIPQPSGDPTFPRPPRPNPNDGPPRRIRRETNRNINFR